VFVSQQTEKREEKRGGRTSSNLKKKSNSNEELSGRPAQEGYRIEINCRLKEGVTMVVPREETLGNMHNQGREDVPEVDLKKGRTGAGISRKRKEKRVRRDTTHIVAKARYRLKLKARGSIPHRHGRGGIQDIRVKCG